MGQPSIKPLARVTAVLLAVLFSQIATSDANLTASLTLHNRSSYNMFSAVWNNGTNCSNRVAFEPPLDINGSHKPQLQVPAGQPIAAGVAIYAMGDKLPVVCDYIQSFTLQPSTDYLLEYDIHDRRCYGQLFRKQGDNYQLVTSGDPDAPIDRFPEFGWDQFEPGCPPDDT